MEIFPGFHPWEIINWSWTFSYFCWLFSNVHSITYTIVEYNSYVLLISMFMVSFFRHANLDLKHYLFIFNPRVSWFVLLFPRELFLFFHSPSVTSDCSCFFSAILWIQEWKTWCFPWCFPETSFYHSFWEITILYLSWEEKKFIK